MKPVIILGAGGHAKVLIDILLMLNREIIGIVGPQKPAGTEFSGIKVLGNDEEISKYSPKEIELVNGIGSIPGKNTRWQITEEMEKKGFIFSQVIHPSAVIANDVILDIGAQIMAGSIIQPSVHIGKFCLINTGVIIDHDCYIHDDCHLAPGVTLSGNVTVGKRTHIGTGSSVIHNINIGDNCIIAAGSIIYKNISANVKFIQGINTHLPARDY